MRRTDRTDAPGRRRWIRVGLTAAVLAVVAWYATRTLGSQWTAFRAAARDLRPDWALIVASTIAVLATYAVLVQSWRVLVRALGGRLGFWEAARIWTVSNLGRYLPGKIWSVGAMGIMAQDAGVPPAAAAGAAVLGLLLNLAAGFVVVALAGGDYLAQVLPRLPHPRVVAAAVGTAGTVAVPLVIPWLTGITARLLRRPVPPPVTPGAFATALAANVAAWVGYGVAFGWLARAVTPRAGGNWGAYVAVYTASYLAGYLALVVPGGVGVREGAMVLALTRGGLASPVDATLLAVASRLWLTVVELAPGLLFLAVRGPRPRQQAAVVPGPPR